MNLPEWTQDPSLVEDELARSNWCAVGVGVLPTGDGVACGKYAPEQREINGELVWVCEEHAEGEVG